MKKITYLLIFVTHSFFAQSGFDIGNELYRKEKYNEAISAYESVLKTKNQSSELHFNLGNAYYKLNKVGPAVYHFEKALQLKPGDPDIRNNLMFAHKMMIDEVKEVPEVGFQKLLNEFTSAFSYNGWAIISIVMSVLFLLFFIGYYFSAITLSKRIFFIGMFAAAFCIAISLLAAFLARESDRRERPAIVYEGIVSVKSEPKSTAADVTILHEGTKVYIKENLDNWYKIQLADGTDGWIPNNTVKALK